MEQENNTWFQSKIVLVPELLRYSHINYILLPLSQIAKSPNTNNTDGSNLTCHHADAEDETKSDDGRSQAVPQQADMWYRYAGCRRHEYYFWEEATQQN